MFPRHDDKDHILWEFQFYISSYLSINIRLVDLLQNWKLVRPPTLFIFLEYPQMYLQFPLNLSRIMIFTFFIIDFLNSFTVHSNLIIIFSFFFIKFVLGSIIYFFNCIYKNLFQRIWHFVWSLFITKSVII